LLSSWWIVRRPAAWWATSTSHGPEAVLRDTRPRSSTSGRKRAPFSTPPTDRGGGGRGALRHDEENGKRSDAANGGTRSSRRRLPHVADELKRGEARIVPGHQRAIGTRDRASPRRSLCRAVPRLMRSPQSRSSPQDREPGTAPKRATWCRSSSQGPGGRAGGSYPHRRRRPDGAELASAKSSSCTPVEEIKRKSGSVRAPALLQREDVAHRGIIRDLFSDKWTRCWSIRRSCTPSGAVLEADRPRFADG